ncbi:MAG: GNAT family N-acetyltransferase [Propionibacteriaceae bacterium]|nr:GNAT family N-acetyltransferase [Propionibacteriaceae bacterium]
MNVLRPEDVTVRAATLDDLGAINALETECFDEDERWDDDAWNVELQMSGLVLVACVKQQGPDCALFEEVASVASFRIAADSSELFNIMTAPQWRGMGLATLLLARGLQWASDQGATEMFLEVRLGNEARALYADAGFVPAYERSNYYGPGSHALVMRRELMSHTAGRQP